MSDYVVKNYLYILIFIPILTYIFYGDKIRDLFKNNKKITQRDTTEAIVLKQYKNVDIQSFHGSLEDLVNLNPFLNVNVDSNLINNDKNISSKTFVETNRWLVLVDVYRNKNENIIFFAIFVINKLPVVNPVFLSNVIKDINLISNNKVTVSIYKDID